MEIIILNHARLRMEQYDVTEAMVQEAIRNPDSLVLSYGNRRIAQKRVGRQLLRVVYEKEDRISIVITVYKARRERYEERHEV